MFDINKKLFHALSIFSIFHLGCTTHSEAFVSFLMQIQYSTTNRISTCHLLNQVFKLKNITNFLFDTQMISDTFVP